MPGLQKNFVGEKQHKVGTTEKRSGRFDRMHQSTLLLLDRIADPDPAVAVSIVVDDLFSQIADYDHDLVYPQAVAMIQRMLDQRLAGEAEHALVACRGVVLKPLTAATCKY